MIELIKTPMFFLIISLFAFEIGCIINKKTKIPLFNPLFISIVIVIMLLKIFKISYVDYNKGTQIISFLLGPATVVLAVPLYKNISYLKQHCIPIVVGIATGTITGIISIIFLCHFLGLSNSMTISMVPKSVTTPIGMEVSESLGGIPSVTVAAIILTGIIGAIIGPFIIKTFKIRDNMAVGTALGTSSHAVGTAKAMEMGELEGAMGSLAIGIAGLMTVLLAPLLVNILHKFI